MSFSVNVLMYFPLFLHTVLYLFIDCYDAIEFQ